MGVLRLVVSFFIFISPSVSLTFFAGSLIFEFDLAWSFLDASMAQDFSDCGFISFFLLVAMALLLTPDDATQAMCDIAVDRAAKLGGT